MKPHNKLLSRVLMLGLQGMLLTGCASEFPSSLPPVAPPAIPPLPAQARASLVETPSMCSSTCSAGLTALQDSLANMPTALKPLALPASAATTP